MGNRVRWRLSGMMALIYAVQGAWWPLLAVHLRDLGISGPGRGWIFATLALASLTTPIGAGQVADRWLSAEKALAICAGLAGLDLWLLAELTGPAEVFACTLAFWLLSGPFLLLGTTVCFAHLRDPEEREWLRVAAESGLFRPPADPIDEVALLERLTQEGVFELFLHRTFPGKTRFSIEGLGILNLHC